MDSIYNWIWGATEEPPECEIIPPPACVKTPKVYPNLLLTITQDDIQNRLHSLRKITLSEDDTREFEETPFRKELFGVFNKGIHNVLKPVE